MIEISRPLIETLKTHAERAFPAESCGLLVGRVNADGTVNVSRVVKSANMADGGGRTRFEIDPQVHFDLIRELANTDTHQKIVGHYHSHPGHRAEPSRHDISMAFEANFVWLITAVSTDGHAKETRTWRLNRAAHTKAELKMQIS